MASIEFQPQASSKKSLKAGVMKDTDSSTDRSALIWLTVAAVLVVVALIMWALDVGISAEPNNGAQAPIEYPTLESIDWSSDPSSISAVLRAPNGPTATVGLNTVLGTLPAFRETPLARFSVTEIERRRLVLQALDNDSEMITLVLAEVELPDEIRDAGGPTFMRSHLFVDSPARLAEIFRLEGINFSPRRSTARITFVGDGGSREISGQWVEGEQIGDSGYYVHDITPYVVLLRTRRDDGEYRFHRLVMAHQWLDAAARYGWNASIWPQDYTAPENPEELGSDGEPIPADEEEDGDDEE